MLLDFWAGRCSWGADDFLAWGGNSTITNMGFCELTGQSGESYYFEAMYGFGKITDWDSAQERTFIGKMYQDFDYAPIATFNLTFDYSSVVTIGEKTIDETPMGSVNASMAEAEWSLDM